MALIVPFYVRRPSHPLGNLSLLASQRRTPGFPSPTIPSLTDNFDDNSLSASWTTGNFADPSASTTGVTVSETSQQLQVTGPASTAAVRYSGLISATTYDVTDSAIFVKVANVASLQGAEIAYLAFGTDVSNHYAILLSTSGGLHLDLQRWVGGGNTTVGQVFFSGITWFRLRHNAADNTVKVDTAPSTASDPPLSSEWVERLSETRNSTALVLTAASLAFGGGLFGSTGTPTVIQFDGFNTATVAGGVSATGASTEDTDTTAGSGTADISVSGASTETADTAAASGTAAIAATGAATESADTTSASGTAAVSASGASTEGMDTTAGAGAVTASATSASTEATDTGSGGGTLPVSGSGASTESSDTGGGVSAASVAATGSSTEGIDTTAAAGAVNISGSGADTEGTDSTSGNGTVAQTSSTGTGASIEDSETTSGAGLTLVSGTGSSLEATDVCSGSGTVLSISFGHVKLWMGTGFVAKPVKVWNGTAWVTKPLKRWTGVTWQATGY